MTFCIYSNVNITDSDSNREHIFPLTLGGNDNFTVIVSKASNTLANRELDEKLKACFFLATNRKKHKSLGHRNQSVSPPKTKITVGTDKSVVLKFDHDHTLQLYSHQRKFFLTADEIKSKGAVFSIKHERNLRLKFTAKVALASGYFVYGSTFVDNVKTSELRALMNYRGECHDELFFKSIVSTGWYWPEPVGDSDLKMHSIFQHLNDMLNCSFVALITSAVPNKIIIAVGVLGHLSGVISCPADCDAFPKYDKYDLGHVVALKGKEIQRFSFRECLQAIASSVNKG